MSHYGASAGNSIGRDHAHGILARLQQTTEKPS